MSSLLSLLPAAKAKSDTVTISSNENNNVSVIQETLKHNIPAYGNRLNGWFPREEADYNDGGAYPEIHMLQYPRNMGRKQEQKGQLIRMNVDKEGKVQLHSLIAKQNQRKGVIVKSGIKDIEGRTIDDNDLAKPSAEEIKRTAEETRIALMKSSKSKGNNKISQARNPKDPTFVRYTPADSNAAIRGNELVQQRIIRVQEVTKDPLLPSSFKHKKAFRAPPSPPAPILRSPPRKKTAEDEKEWSIAPCVSGWKNPGGNTISLAERLASDGRSMTEHKISNKFASLAEVLMVADNTLRKEVEQRQMMSRKVSLKAKEQEEERLLKEAIEARAMLHNKKPDSDRSDDDDSGYHNSTRSSPISSSINEREELRRDRKREIKREMRMEKRRQEKLNERGYNDDNDDNDRDISEKIALGKAVQPTKDMQLDVRLLNQTEGMDSGFGEGDDSYNIYSKPLFKASSANALYRPTVQSNYESADDIINSITNSSTTKFKPTRGFDGADIVESTSGPVQFQKDNNDPFGLNTVLAPGTSASSSAVVDHGNMNKNDNINDHKTSDSRRRSRRSRSRSRSRDRYRSRKSSRRRSTSRSRSKSRDTSRRHKSSSSSSSSHKRHRRDY